MKINRLASLLATIALIAACASPAMAQAFLNPVSAQQPTFLQNGTVNSGGAVGNLTNSSNLLTGPGAFNAGVVKGRQLSLQTSGNGLLAPNSVNMAPFPSGSYNYGFTGGGAVPGLANHYGNYNGQALPVCSTGSVDLNIVDCPNVASNYGPGQVNPYAVINNLAVMMDNGTMRTINFQETQSESAAFLQQSFEDAAPPAF
jgi:hypothetical protein